MKRWILIILIVLAQIVLVYSRCEAGASATGTFKMSVTIPAIIGLNVPDPNAPVKPNSTSLELAQNNVFSNVETQLTEMMMMRDNQNVRVQTIVIR